MVIFPVSQLDFMTSEPFYTGLVQHCNNLPRQVGNRMSDLKETPLAEEHEALGARMVPFAGWRMPVQYGEGILAEHHHTRRAVSVFDCSHMGQFRLSGPAAEEDLDALLPRSASDQPIGSCRYNFLLTKDGTIVDDIIVYRLGVDEFYIVVNAGTREGDANHLCARVSADTAFIDESATTAKLDIQGPSSAWVLEELGFIRESLPAYFRFVETEWEGIPLLLSRTGYTGECGYELYFNDAHAPRFWEMLLAAKPVKPAGLGARDTLRLEMGYPLYGHELNRQTTPVEAGFGPMLDLDRPFVGRDALRDKPPTRKLVGVRFEGRRAAREETPLTDAAGKVIGTVTSGSFSPSLETAIALAYVQPDLDLLGKHVAAKVGRSEIQGVVVRPPFYREGTARMSI